MAQPDYSWITKVTQGGPYESSVVIKANPAWASLITKRMQPYKSLPNLFKPALESVADYVRQDMIPRTFSQEGPGWRKLSKRTRRERLLEGYQPQHPILRRSGDLFKELTDRSHPKHVEFITTGPNSRVIIGGRSEKYVRNQLGNAMFRIPMRPMIPGTGWLPVGEKDDQSIKAIFTQKIGEAVAGSHG